MLSELSEMHGEDISKLQTLGQISQEMQESIFEGMKRNSQLQVSCSKRERSLKSGSMSLRKSVKERKLLFRTS